MKKFRNALMQKSTSIYANKSESFHFYQKGAVQKKTKHITSHPKKRLFVNKGFVGELNPNKPIGIIQIDKTFISPSATGIEVQKRIKIQNNRKGIKQKNIQLGYFLKKGKKSHLSTIRKLSLPPFYNKESFNMAETEHKMIGQKFITILDRRIAHKLKLYNNKKIWYYNKAIAIPGSNRKLSVGFARKNKFYKKVLNFYLQVKNFIPRFNKKKIIKLFSNRNNLNLENSIKFSTLLLIDSLFRVTFKKRNPAFHIVDDFSINSKNNKIHLNGKFVFKNSFINKKAVLKDGCFRMYPICKSRVY